MTSIHVLLVEDDEKLATLTSQYMESHGMLVSVVGTGPAAVAAARAQPFDVVLLDVMLPGGMSGFEVCKAIRQTSAVPIVMLTARTDEADRVLGFNDGADDYVPKPFLPRELVARVDAHVRRARGQVGPASAAPLQAGSLRMEPATMTISKDGVVLPMTSHEALVLRIFLERQNRVLSREQIQELVSGDASLAFDRAVDVTISRLRHKLGDDPKNPMWIKTVRGMGYLFAVPPAGASS
jgi:two-component system, OmpR family, response regulator